MIRDRKIYRTLHVSCVEAMTNMDWRVLFIVHVLSLGFQISWCAECATHCPDGWLYFRNSCYFFATNTEMDWTGSENYCQVHHQAHLVVIDNHFEDLFLQHAARQHKQANFTYLDSFYTAGSDSEIDGIWEWYTDFQDFTYTNWAPGQPGSDTNSLENCLALNALDAFTWHDFPCDYKMHPLCELEQCNTDEAILGK